MDAEAEGVIDKRQCRGLVDVMVADGESSWREKHKSYIPFEGDRTAPFL
jgi:hypothetical protein